LQVDLKGNGRRGAIKIVAEELFQFSMHGRLEQLIRYSKYGAAYFKHTLTLKDAESSDLVSRLLILPEHVSEESTTKAIKEYCTSLGIVNVEIPLTVQNIRDHISIITKFDLGDYAVCAHIVKAFTEVGFDNCPAFLFDNSTRLTRTC
jgi:hypothetical protein